MNFSTSTLRPGKVLEVVDERGTVKASAPGLFSANDDPSLLPPVYPIGYGGGRGSYSSPLVGDRVWVLHDNANTQLFLYIRYNDLPYEVTELLDKNTETEVVFSRDTDAGVFQIYFSSGEGVKLTGAGSYILIHTNGDIDIVSGGNGRSISLSDDSICLGQPVSKAGGVSTHAAYGESVEDALDTIYNILLKLKTGCVANPYTSNVSALISTTDLAKLQKIKNECTSNDIKII